MVRCAGVCVLAVAVTIVLPACKERGSQATSATSAPKAPADKTYTLRGRITGFPNPPREFLRIHHEAIPQFEDGTGRVVGMEEMEMQFPFLSAGAEDSLKALSLSDPVEATMEMRYKGEPRFLITRITKLPADAALRLGTIQTEEPK
jgi:hypothetical protein